MSLDDLRYCTLTRRLVGTTEFHAGVFSSRNCSGCHPLDPWMEDIVESSIRADLERAKFHLELLVRGRGTS